MSVRKILAHPVVKPALLAAALILGIVVAWQALDRLGRYLAAGHPRPLRLPQRHAVSHGSGPGHRHHGPGRPHQRPRAVRHRLRGPTTGRDRARRPARAGRCAGDLGARGRTSDGRPPSPTAVAAQPATPAPTATSAATQQQAGVSIGGPGAGAAVAIGCSAGLQNCTQASAFGLASGTATAQGTQSSSGPGATRRSCAQLPAPTPASRATPMAPGCSATAPTPARSAPPRT